jgi:caffeoyl-CoA O-methyltransferase
MAETVDRRRSLHTDPLIDAYAGANSTPPDAHQLELARRTAATGRQMMQIGDDLAALMEMIVRAMGATSAVEVGTFTGYSALAVARGLGEGGHLLCCDVSEEWTAIAREAWDRAGVSDRIELRLGPALATLQGLPEAEQFDFAFIDADKGGYPDYYEAILPRLRVGGLILFDNMLSKGKVLDATNHDKSVDVVRELNASLARDSRVKAVLLVLGEGVSVVQKL